MGSLRDQNTPSQLHTQTPATVGISDSAAHTTIHGQKIGLSRAHTLYKRLLAHITCFRRPAYMPAQPHGSPPISD